jgi:hypothetical protein
MAGEKTESLSLHPAHSSLGGGGPQPQLLGCSFLREQIHCLTVAVSGSLGGLCLSSLDS